MNLFDGGMIAIIIVVLLIGSYSTQKWLGHDNVIEEFTEEVIEAQTGIDIDLSFDSPEDENNNCGCDK